MARPQKYNDDMQAKAEDYYKNHESLTGDVVPSVCGLACYLEVIEKTLYNWRDVHPQFLHTLAKIKEKQKKLLLNNGLTGEFNSNITKLMLGNHGFHEKKDIDHSGEITTKTIDLTKLTKQELEDLEKLTAKLES